MRFIFRKPLDMDKARKHNNYKRPKLYLYKELVPIAIKTLNQLMVSSKPSYPIRMRVRESIEAGHLIEYTLDQAKAYLNLMISTKNFRYKLDDKLKQEFIKYIWQWKNIQISNIIYDIYHKPRDIKTK
jgi:hypothetical protein